MLFLIIVGFLIPLVFIGYWISKLDTFLEKGGFEVEDSTICPIAIILGETEIAKKVVKLLEKNKIPVCALTEPFLLRQEQNFRYIFALSEKDADNIVLCKIGRKIYSIEKMISICNDQKNIEMYLSEKINCISSEEASEHKLLQFVLPLMDTIL